MSFIVQLPLTSSTRMSSVRHLLRSKSEALYVVPFDDRPGKLFEGLEHCRSVIFIAEATKSVVTSTFAATRYLRWPTELREYLFTLLDYSRVHEKVVKYDIFPKYSNITTNSILAKLNGQAIVDFETVAHEHPIYVHRIIGYFVKAMDFVPYFWNETEGQKRSRKTVVSKTTGKVIYDEFNPGACKNIMDKIDHVLAKHYDFTDKELDFIINYDIKYRMSRNNERKYEE